MSETAVVSGSGKPLRVRMLVVGAEGVGKSCLIKRYCEKRFVPRYAPTVGIDYGATKIYVDRRAVAVHIFDTSGAPVFRDVRNEFYRDAHGVVLVFDVARRDTFDALCNWTKEIYLELAKEGRDLDKAVVMVCANKTDLKARQVDELEARMWADLRGFSCFETSAYSGAGVADMFRAFFSRIVRAHDEDALPKTPASARKTLHKCSSNAAVSTSSPTSTASASPSIVDKALFRKSASAAEMTTGPTTPDAALTSTPPTSEQLSVMERLRQFPRDPWQQMGLVAGCSRDDVNRTYRKLAMMLHPDKTAVRGADEAFKSLGIARRNILKALGAL